MDLFRVVEKFVAAHGVLFMQRGTTNNFLIEPSRELYFSSPNYSMANVKYSFIYQKLVCSIWQLAVNCH